MSNTKSLAFKSPQENMSMSPLEELLKTGAQKMLQKAIENEVAEYVNQYASYCDENGHRKVVRNGYLPERDIVTGIGKVRVKQPRIDDRKMSAAAEYDRFTSKILPPGMRRIPSIDNLIPVLYLKGVSTNDFPTALQAILGPHVSGLSSTNIVRLKSMWEQEYKDWNKRDLSTSEYVYWWVDGIYFNIRLDDERQCILVIIGATKDGNKELVAISDGFRESKTSWKEILLSVKQRGLKKAPKLAVADGALGFWAALREVYGTTREQRCWVHKTANILDKLPKSMRTKAKSMIHEMYMAEKKVDALNAYELFVETYGDKYPKAVKCLTKDKDLLFTFYNFPGAHWSHIRTTNPIESTFSTVRLRTKRTRGCGSRTATLTMVFKLVKEAEKLTFPRFCGQ